MEVFGIVITGTVIVFLGRLGYVVYQSMVRADTGGAGISMAQVRGGGSKQGKPG
jgi:hypothetical protein